MKKLALLLFACVVMVVAAPPMVAPAKKKPAIKIDPEIQSVLDRFDAFQEKTKTIRATFRQENHSSLLVEPLILEGTLSIERPSSIHYSYTSPSRLTFVIRDGWLTAHDPDRKLAAKVDVRRYEKKVFRYMGLSEPLTELLEHFTPTLEPATVDGADRLVLTSSSRKTRDKLAALVFEMDSTTGEPKKMEIHQKDGDKVVFAFLSFETNIEFEETFFNLQLPRGTKLTDDILELMDPIKN